MEFKSIDVTVEEFDSTTSNRGRQAGDSPYYKWLEAFKASDKVVDALKFESLEEKTKALAGFSNQNRSKNFDLCFGIKSRQGNIIMFRNNTPEQTLEAKNKVAEAVARKEAREAELALEQELALGD